MDCVVVPCEFGRILKFENDSSQSIDSINVEEKVAEHTKYLQPNFRVHENYVPHAKTCVKRQNLDSRVRRLRANDRERRRIQSINGAMEALRKAIPDTREKRKITKLQILRLAQRYIQTLTEILRTDSQISPMASDASILEFHAALEQSCCDCSYPE